jgi:hypothetical protein
MMQKTMVQNMRVIAYGYSVERTAIKIDELNRGPDGIHRPLMSVKNSSRVFCWVRKQPIMHEVVVIAPGFCTPRMVMHMCLPYDEQRGIVPAGRKAYVASMTTATPRGLIASSTARAICFVSRSWTCRRRANVSAIRASFEMPRTSWLGM